MKPIIRVLIILLIMVLCSCCEKEQLPQVHTGKLLVFSETAYCYGWVFSNGATEVDKFGFIWSKSDEPEIQNSKVATGNGTNYFGTTIRVLSPNTTYTLKAFADYKGGTLCGEEKQITTTQIGNFTDSRDGRTYKWVEIGNLIWMAENLAYLPYISPFTNDSGIFVYNYKGTSVDAAKQQDEFTKYGCLYSWEIASKACPEGWHLPDLGEWQELETSIGMTLHQMSQVSEAFHACLLQSTDWSNHSNNATSFAALPAGYHQPSTYDYYFDGLGNKTYYWASTINDDMPYILSLDYGGVREMVASKDNGNSIRCVKNY
jgi:uncharacterized protein (TIGR02145 family)